MHKEVQAGSKGDQPLKMTMKSLDPLDGLRMPIVSIVVKSYPMREGHVIAFTIPMTPKGERG